MADPYIGEIRLMSFNAVPRNWMPCEGQILLVSANQALFSLIGFTFGNNGPNAFKLPDLRDRVPMHPGRSYTQGLSFGASSHALSFNELPAHTHTLYAVSDAADSSKPTGAFLATPDGTFGAAYGAPSAINPPQMGAGTISFAGSDQAHENRQPYVALTFCICVNGIFPSRS